MRKAVPQALMFNHGATEICISMGKGYTEDEQILLELLCPFFLENKVFNNHALAF